LPRPRRRPALAKWELHILLWEFQSHHDILHI
jgi:hypothetical protein